ncbi:MAG: ERF family protein [Desulfamplus sp.]|nr:ERF family protein [Desulfamplus sp.]
MNIYQKLLLVQSQLKAPKGQLNKFGNFKYRSLEDIVEEVKPLLVQHTLSLTLSDTVKQIGDRFYIEATALLVNAEKPEEKIITTALAREAATKKGMDESQITGAASSYARKYCLNGLFNIDDTKDADTQPPINQKSSTQNNQKPPAQKNNNKPVTHPQGLDQAQLNWLSAYCQRKGYTDNTTKKEFMDFYGFSPRTTPPDIFIKIQQQIEADESAVSESPF